MAPGLKVTEEGPNISALPNQRLYYVALGSGWGLPSLTLLFQVNNKVFHSLSIFEEGPTEHWESRSGFPAAEHTDEN